MYIQNENFIKQRQNDLEVYLLTVIHKLGSLPKELAEFLDFGQYEVNSICECLAKELNGEALEKMVKSEEAYAICPLKLHAVSERLKLPASSSSSTSQQHHGSNPDTSLATILEFFGAVKTLRIEGTDQPLGTSNIVPNRLTVDLTPFRSVRTLVVSTFKSYSIAI